MEVRVMVIKKEIKFHSAQALVELALGMFCVALILAALFAFLHYIVSSMNMSRDVRAKAGRAALVSAGWEESYSSSSESDTVTVSPMAAEYVFGTAQLEIKEEVHIPNMRIPQH